MERRGRISVVVLSYNRAERLAQTLESLFALPERPPVCVVDNGSHDGSVELVRQRFPDAELVALTCNIGAGARNLGVDLMTTPFVAFADDDTVWEPGSLWRACDLFDAWPRVAVLGARILVGTQAREDPICRRMEASPLPRNHLPGPALIGFLAGACAFRRSAYVEAGGYEPRFMIGGEEELLALDLLTLGWAIVYAPELVVRHYPFSERDHARRRTHMRRNELWAAWLRRPLGVALRRTAALVVDAAADRACGRALAESVRGLPWALRRRCVVPGRVEALCRLAERDHGAAHPLRETND
jgi:GT2 family glycosyltransferase